MNAGPAGEAGEAGEAAVARARAEIAACGRELLARGLLSQTAGNLSVRVGGQFCITPSAMEYDRIIPADVAVIGLDGRQLGGARRPSSETPLHRAIYASRPDAGAIVHAHSPYATTLAILGEPIPAVHYMIAATGSTRVEVAGYATYGTAELARAVADAFPAPARAVLLANHGMVAVGATLGEAASVAQTVETLAGLYYRALAVGTPRVLTDEQMADVLRAFAGYRAP